MYFVKYGDSYLYDPRVHLSLPSAKLETELNSSDVFNFSLHVTHPMYDKIKERDRDNPVTVFSDSTIIFRGEITNIEKDFYLNKKVECRGELAYLNDTLVRPYSTEQGEVSRKVPSTVNGYFKFLIQEHNSQSEKKFVIGENEGASLDPNNLIHRADTTYPTVGATIKDKILKTLGGYLDLEYNLDGTRTISLVSDFPKVNAQTINFGVNLLDFTKENDFSDVYSYVIPVGKAVDDKNDKTIDERITIKDEEDWEIERGYRKKGDLIYSENAVEKYGWVGALAQFDDVTQPSLLVNKGLASLKELEQGTVTIEIKAIDLSMIKPDYEPITIGQYVRVCSKPHDFDSYMLVSKIVYDLIKPDNDTFTLGTTYKTLTGLSNASISALNSTINENYQSAMKSITDLSGAKEAAEEAKEAAQYATSTVGELAERVGNAESFLSTVNDTFIEFEAECEDMRTVFESERIGIRDAFDSEVAQMNADFDAKIETVNTNFETQSNQLRSDFETQTSTIVSNFETKTAQLESDFETQTGTITSSFETQTNQLRSEFEEFKSQVGEASVADGSITTEKLADGAVTADKVNLSPLDFSETGNGLGICTEAPDEGLGVGGTITHTGQDIIRNYTGGQVREYLKRTDFDSRRGVMPSATQYLASTYLRNAYDESNAWDQTYVATSGKLWRSIGIGSYDENGENQIKNSVAFAIDKNGNREVSVSDGAAWRTGIGAAAESHNHSAADITSGTLPVARGGTGGTTAATARSALGAAAKSWTKILDVATGADATLDLTGYSEILIVGYYSTTYLSSVVIPVAFLGTTVREVYLGGVWTSSYDRGASVSLSKTSIHGWNFVINGSNKSGTYRVYGR